MSRLPLLLALTLSTLVLVAAGCGGSEEVSPTPATVEGTLPEETTAEEPAATLEGDADAGEELFAANGCGGCHTLEAAGSSGNVGPNLDEADPDFERAVQVISNGAGAMPAFKDQLEPQQIADVAAFVTGD
ncbi:MAG TPA: c-type cytochrome [Gaiellaceae bacterium]|jgi:mono/diheme cytochrome c family protein|nr:c-type cytochrome [Gaiellaceae bacterium]